MSLTIPNPTYATSGPTKTYQVFAPNELSSLEVAFVGRTTITLDGTIKTGTINFIDGTQAIFSNSISQAYPNQGLGTIVAPAAVTASLVGAGGNSGSNVVADLEGISINTGTPTTTGFPFYLSAAGNSGDTLTIQFSVYRS